MNCFKCQTCGLELQTDDKISLLTCGACKTKMEIQNPHAGSEAVSAELGLLSAEQLAEKFHTLYEGFAPEYGYKTRPESAVPWADVPEKNKKLMIRVCRTILGRT